MTMMTDDNHLRKTPKISQWFLQIDSYLQEGFRQIRSYLPEGFRKISSYLPEGFRQITSSINLCFHSNYVISGPHLRQFS